MTDTKRKLQAGQSVTIPATLDIVGLSAPCEVEAWHEDHGGLRGADIEVHGAFLVLDSEWFAEFADSLCRESNMFIRIDNARYTPQLRLSLDSLKIHDGRLDISDCMGVESEITAWLETHHSKAAADAEQDDMRQRARDLRATA